jgi:hypothetical protein
MTYEQMVEMVDRVLLEWKAGARVLHPTFITHTVCSAHIAALPKNAHGDFWRFTGYTYIRELVRKRINVLFDKGAETSRQMFLPGYKHLQSHYVVKRGDDRVGVPTNQLTGEEIEALAVMHDAMAASCTDHAAELRRYDKERRQLAGGKG